LILSGGIKHSMPDSLCDVNYPQRCAMGDKA